MFSGSIFCHVDIRWIMHTNGSKQFEINKRKKSLVEVQESEHNFVINVFGRLLLVSTNRNRDSGTLVQRTDEALPM